jgi:hypothetical protein
MDRTAWLRDRMAAYGCATCGRGFEPGGVRVLAERDGLWFLELACIPCASRSVAIVTVAADAAGDPALDAPDLEPRRPATRTADPIGVDDVLAIHALLDTFQGDVTALLRRLDGAEGPVRR